MEQSNICSFFFAKIALHIIERQKGKNMRDAQLDVTKLSKKERVLRKIYLEGLRNLKKEDYEELKKEAEERYQAYLDGSVVNLSRAFGSYSNIRRLLEELIELEEDIEELEDLEKEDNGEFVF